MDEKLTKFLNQNQKEEEQQQQEDIEQEENDIPIDIKDNLGSIEPPLVPTIINTTVKNNSNYNNNSISPRIFVLSEENGDNKYESKLRYKYLKKHPELIDISEYIYLSCLKDKPDDILSYCSNKFEDKNDIKFMKELKLSSRRLAGM